MKITFVTFNLEKAGRYANGPGMCLLNLIKILRERGHQVEVYSKLTSEFARPLHQFPNRRLEVVHHWSGTDLSFVKYLRGEKNIVGPNVLDTVYPNKEKPFLRHVPKNTKFLSVNPLIKDKLIKAYQIENIDYFMVGPDLKEWAPTKKDNFILWKGNCKHYAKDIDFALRVREKLKNKYRFIFLGYPKPYHYLEHINLAKRAKIYFSSSISETMGLAVLEQMACKTPVVTHPKIYISGKDRETGRVVAKNLNEYCQAIESLMEDNDLWNKTSEGALKYVEENFNDELIYQNYLNILGN